jgi:hypothetical protein
MGIVGRTSMPQKTVREILNKLSPLRSDMKLKDQVDQAIASLKALMLEWVGEDKGRGSVVPVEDVYSVTEVRGYINGFNDRGAEMRQKIEEATK